MEKEAVHKQEPGIKMINIISVNFNSNHSAVIANLKTSSNKATIMVSYKIDTGSDGTIMLFYILPKLFPCALVPWINWQQQKVQPSEDI